MMSATQRVTIISFLLTLFLLPGCADLSTILLPTEPDDPKSDSPGPDDTVEWTSRFLYEDNLAWASRRDLTSAQFGDAFDSYRDRGYMIVDVDVRTVGTSARYSMVWHENPDRRAWAEHRNLTSDQYHALWERYRDDGYRPLDVEAYLLNGKLRFAGIWIENREGLAWSSIRNMTSSEYAAYFDQRRAEGHRPIDIEIYPTGSGLRVAAIWYENVDGLAWTQLRNIDRDRYQQEADKHAADGYQMLDFESYEGSGEQLYAAIWEKPAVRPASQIRTNRSRLGFANLWRTYRDQGYRLADFENYNTSGEALYGGIWIENADRYRYASKDALDTAIQKYREDNTIPGISVAVIHQGQVVYRRGFGEADVSASKVAHSETVYLAASVSKVIGGTLAAKLEDEGSLQDGTTFSLDLSDPTSKYLLGLPNHHSHQVDELTAHLGCVAHYETSPPIANQTTHYDTATQAVKSIWNTGLVNPCVVGQNRSYSTHGFTFVGAVLEQATGRSIDRLLEDELSAPYSLDSMRAQFASRALPPDYERAVPYKEKGGSTSYRDNSWKVLGGGIEINALDLARFGWLVQNGSIINAAARDDRMWSPVDPDCSRPGPGTCRNGIGWELHTRGGRRVAEHGGAARGARAFLRIYRDDDLVIAVMSNEKGHDPGSLTTTIANVILAP